VLVVQNVVAVDSVEAGEAKAGWQADWEKTVKAAEKKGEIVVHRPDGLDLVFRAGLQRKYPKIKVTTLIGRGFELGQRVRSEYVRG